MTMYLKCDYCGKLFEKFDSSIRRTRHNFCSQECYHRFRTKPINVCDKDFKMYYTKYYKLFLKLVNLYDIQYFDELMQIARITLWKTIGNNNKKRLDLLNMDAYLTTAILRQIKIFFRSEKIKRTITFSQLEENSTLEIPYYEYEQEDKIYYEHILTKVLEYFLESKKSLSLRILFEREFLNNSIKRVATKYNISQRQVTKNCYAVKKRLRKRVKQWLLAESEE